MNEIGFEHENNRNYMTITINDDVDCTGYQIKMITKNQINELLPVAIRSINNKRIFYYDITSKQQFGKLYDCTKINWEDVVNVCLGISAMVKAVNEYMLDLDGVIMHPDFMYIDVFSKAIRFTYNPAQSQNFDEGIQELFNYILEHFDHNAQRSELMRMYSLYQKVLHKEYDLENMLDLVNDEKDCDEEKYKETGYECNEHCNDEKNLPEENSFINDKCESKKIIDVITKEEIHNDVEKIDYKKSKTIKIMRMCFLVMSMYGLVSMFFPEYNVLNLNFTINVVVVFSGLAGFMKMCKMAKRNVSGIKEEVEEQPYCIENKMEIDEYENEFRQDESCEIKENADYDQYKNTMLLSEYLNNEGSGRKGVKLIFQKCENAFEEDMTENIFINTFPCVIGSMKEYCDILISNVLISRMHFCIKKENGQYYAEDMNSTNGTYVNEKRLMSNERVELNTGDTIRLADVVYKVEIS